MQMKTIHLKKLPSFMFVVILVVSTGCTLDQLGASYDSSGGLQVYPSSTTLGLNQDMSLQVTGGTPPYQYQVSGTGSIDQNGNFQAGSVPGQAQITVSDATGLTVSSSVNIVQTSSNYNSPSTGTNGYSPLNSYGSTNTSGGYSNSYPSSGSTPNLTYSNYSMQRLETSSLAGVIFSPLVSNNQNWTPLNQEQLKKVPPVLGKVVGSNEKVLDAAGDTIRSQFIETNLKHPIVREDTLVEAKQVVAVRAIVEDQFLIELYPTASQYELQKILDKEDAHISKILNKPNSYLISMTKAGANKAETEGKMISPDFFAKRARLKQELQTIAKVSPNYISEAPSHIAPAASGSMAAPSGQ
jgi:hypothetical protein